MEISITSELNEAINHAEQLKDILVNLSQDADENATLDTKSLTALQDLEVILGDNLGIQHWLKSLKEIYLDK
jgi:hypothetical protein